MGSTNTLIREIGPALPVLSVSDLRNISTEYPGTFPLSGLDLIWFGYRLKKLLADERFSCYDLHSLREKLDPPNTRGKRPFASDLENLGYVKYADMPPEILSTLSEVVGAYFGIKIYTGKKAVAMPPCVFGPPQNHRARHIVDSVWKALLLIALVMGFVLAVLPRR